MNNLFNPFRKPLLLIELSDNKITFAKAQKKWPLYSIYIINVSNTNTSTTTLKSGVLYNQTRIKSMVCDFIKQEKLKKPQTIISMPALAQMNDLSATLATLQVALCISKANTKILEIINTPIFDDEHKLIFNTNQSQNLLDLLGNNKIHSPYKWMAGIIACMALSIASFSNLHNKNKAAILSVQKSNSLLQTRTDKLNEQVKNFAQTKASNEQIKKSFSKLEKSKKCTQNPLNHILALSSKIPSTSYLTHINIIKQPNKEESQAQKVVFKNKYITTIEFQGITQRIQAANQFIQAMAQDTKLFSKIDLSYIKKVKSRPNSKKNKKTNSKKRSKYAFKASGQLNYIC